jgi:UDP-3-O-[3-hydroxymyristoyl] glucosamine N-acyltransferase
VNLAELAGLIGARLEGADADVSGVAEPGRPAAGRVVFAADAGSLATALSNGASAVLVSEELALVAPPARTLLVSSEPRRSFIELLRAFSSPAWTGGPGVHPTAWVDPAARLADGVSVGPHAVIGPDSSLARGVSVGPGAMIGSRVEIGEDTVVWARAVVCDRVRIGRRCSLLPGSVVGSDGFGYEEIAGRRSHRPHLGTVTIGDDVDVGANAVIARGTIADTVIESGVKIDSLCQIAHNVRIGPGTVLAGQVGIAGSVSIGAGVMLAGQVGVADHLEIGDGAFLMAQAGVPQSVPAGARLVGAPARPVREFLRQISAGERLDELARRVKALEQERRDR